MARKVKGMVQAGGTTYRIVRVAAGTYAVERISDDLDVGSFRLVPELSVEARGVEPAVLREIARLAIHAAKTSSVGYPRPEPLRLDPAPATAARRTPSSTPPALPAL
jgi:hypothetical protein